HQHIEVKREAAADACKAEMPCCGRSAMRAQTPIPHRPWRRISLACVAAMLLGGCARGILAPQGPVGAAEKTLLLNATGIMLC
ncbi:hypothetical protein C1X58_30255, partial [Pseudomonas sp. FW215-R4]